MERLRTSTVGDIVAADFRAAGVFERFGIDFCCGGRRSLSEACRSANADPEEVERELATLPALDEGSADMTQWPLADLIDHIVSKHHAYLRSALPTIARYLAKLQDVHGARHPELARVTILFESLRAELEQHTAKEEQILFPYIRDLADNADEPCGGLMSPFGTVANPIRMMEREHDEAAEALRQIRALTDNYTAPADGCTTYQVCMVELAAFEHDLHRHVHLENNVLFPRAIELERAVSAR